MELRIPAIPEMDAFGHLGRHAGSSGEQRDPYQQCADDRQHSYQSAPSGRWRKRGTQKQGFGRSRGGFTTKIHLRTNAIGLPLAAEISGGEVSDYKGYDLVMDTAAPAPKVFLADRGYDADRIRTDLEARGAVPIIPGRKTRKNPILVDEYIYALRNRVERAFSKLKCSRRLATRYDKTADSYLGFVHISSIRLWIREFVNRA